MHPHRTPPTPSHPLPGRSLAIRPNPRGCRAGAQAFAPMNRTRAPCALDLSPREEPPVPTDPNAEIVRRITRARLAAALSRLQAVAAAPDWDRVPRCDRLAILSEIRATVAALDRLREENQ